jgi:hypothetical protein
MRTLRCHLIVGLLSFIVPAQGLLAQGPVTENAQRDLTVSAAAVAQPVLQHRLLPAEYELRDGNAATILLRLPSWAASDRKRASWPKPTACSSP